MAATSFNLPPFPVAHPAFVDSDFGSTLAARQITVNGPEHFVTGSYIIVGQDLWANPTPRVTSLGDFVGGVQSNCVIVSEKTAAPSGNITAATLSWAFAPARRPRFVTEMPICAAEYWTAAERPSLFVSVKVCDRRLVPFYDSLARIERGEWDSQLGKVPSATALTKAKAVLNQLSGSPISPTRVVAGDGLVVIYFSAGEKYSKIEILNSGMMLMLNSDGHTVPPVRRFTLPSLSSIIDQIRAHVA